MGIIGSILRRRDSAGGFRTIDGGHPAPYPDMTDEQLYNYEITFKVPHRTFDRPPVSAAPAPTKEAAGQPYQEQAETPTIRRSATEKVLHSTRFNARRVRAESPGVHRTEPEADLPEPPPASRSAAPGMLDLSRPVRLVTTKQPVEIITTRARHPIYKVHGYIGDADIATVFTLDGRLSENGPCFLENVPEQHQLYLNIYLSEDPASGDRYRIMQHASMEEAEATAAGRVASVAVQFDL